MDKTYRWTLTTHLRRRFSANKYVGLELEMNQALEPRAYARLLVAALQIVLSA